jgi:hypothetical protein
MRSDDQVRVQDLTARDLLQIRKPRCSTSSIGSVRRAACCVGFSARNAMEDALGEINEILERKAINDKHKVIILRENARRFYISGASFSLLH